MTKLSDLVSYLDTELRSADVPDYDAARAFSPSR